MAGFLSGSESKAVLLGTLLPSVAIGTMFAFSHGVPPEPIQLSVVFSVIAWFFVVVLAMLPATLLHDLLERFTAPAWLYAAIWALVPIVMFTFVAIERGKLERLTRADDANLWRLFIVVAAGSGGEVYRRISRAAAAKRRRPE